MRILIYDCEIINCIPSKYEEPDPELIYCGGWEDYEGMGISLIGTWSNWDDAIRLFPKSAFDVFQELVYCADVIVGFNSKRFDDNLCKANGINVFTHYDLLQEVWAAAGMPRQYTYGVTRPGYKLESLAQANLGRGKSGSGDLAPVLWQKGRQWAVARYLTDDILVTKAIWDRRNNLIDPTTGDILKLKTI